MERTNTESHRSAVGHLEKEDKAAIVACCCSLGVDSEVRWDMAVFIEELCWRELKDERR